MSNLRVIIAGGGTGGHIFSAVAVGHALQKLQPGTQLLFVGAQGRMEMEKVPQEGFEIIGLDIAGFNRSNMLKNLSLPYKLLKSMMQARTVLKKFRPHAVMGVGGYASFPVLNAAQKRRIPTLIQEQNSFAGRSNMILGKKANAICVAYEHMERFFPKDKIVVTGNPVRKNISQQKVTKEDAQKFFALDANKKTLLIIGGSLGARSVNEAIDAGLDEILYENVQVIWQTGKPYYEQAKQRVKSLNDKVKLFEFIREMEFAYTAADIVISRAGALAIAELCIVAKPVIFVPFPYAAEDHQTSNAMALVNNKAAMVVKDSEVKMELVNKLRELLHNAEMRQTMSRNLEKLAITDADERIAKQVIKIAGIIN
jgi:UDP-N-acetylglucosamine--N-acetylmuramyl-(pentapeptide) pyrophosphoryl-undecaprenol N-acetylglucosamine transferase